MSHSTTNETRPPVSAGLVILILGAALIAALLVFGLYALAAPGDRPSVLQWLTGLGTLAASALSGTAVAQVRKVSQVASKIDKQTNGVLDARIRDGVSAALVDHGIPLARRTGDTGEPGDEPASDVPS